MHIATRNLELKTFLKEMVSLIVSRIITSSSVQDVQGAMDLSLTNVSLPWIKHGIHSAFVAQHVEKHLEKKGSMKKMMQHTAKIAILDNLHLDVEVVIFL